MVWSIRAEYRARGPRQERAYDQIEMRLQFISRNVRSIERSNYQPRASRTWWRRVDGVRWTRYSPDDGEEETGKKRGTRPGSRLAWQEQTGSAYAAGDPGNSTIRLLVERVSRENWRERDGQALETEGWIILEANKLRPSFFVPARKKRNAVLASTN